MSKKKTQPSPSPAAPTAADDCSKCGSPNSKPIGDELVQQVRGDIFAARPLLQIRRQRVRCTKCGQVRMRRSVTPVAAAV